MERSLAGQRLRCKDALITSYLDTKISGYKDAVPRRCFAGTRVDISCWQCAFVEIYFASKTSCYSDSSILPVMFVFV